MLLSPCSCRLLRWQSRHSLPRAFSTSSSISSPVALSSDTYPASSPKGGPVVILHGLYGSKQNWRSLAKGMAKRLERQVVALDLRNHGTSPHDPGTSYLDMASDVTSFMKERGMEDVTLLGHSMGGKVAMTVALSGEKALSKLIVVDMAPGVGSISVEFKRYLEAMQEIDSALVKSRKEADAILAKYEPDLSIRQFLLTNLERSDSTNAYKFRLPLDYLSKAIQEIGDFPYDPKVTTWDGPALFLKGSKSKYINRHNTPLIEAFFPAMQLKILEAGHWVHAERPKEFMDEVAHFVQ